jgi:DNA-binding NarL/FixJ family response regulator
MLSLIASWVLTLVAVALAAYVVSRSSQNAHKLKGELDRELKELKTLIAAARQESQRLQAAIARANSLGLAARLSTLAAIERLAEAAALDDPRAIVEVAARTAQLPAGVAEDLFEADEKMLTIARLIDQGHSADDIARRLNLPIGEVELLSSLRPA